MAQGKNAAPVIVGAAMTVVTTDPEPVRSPVPGLVDSEQTPAAGPCGYSQERVGSTGGPDESWATGRPDEDSGVMRCAPPPGMSIRPSALLGGMY